MRGTQAEDLCRLPELQLRRLGRSRAPESKVAQVSQVITAEQGWEGYPGEDGQEPPRAQPEVGIQCISQNTGMPENSAGPQDGAGVSRERPGARALCQQCLQSASEAQAHGASSYDNAHGEVRV